MPQIKFVLRLAKLGDPKYMTINEVTEIGVGSVTAQVLSNYSN